MKRILTNCFSLAFLFMLLSLDGCLLFPDPKETLPPATQTGANTFGFLLNGQVWVPKGNDGYPNLSPYYDPNFNGQPEFDISCYRYVSTSERQAVGFFLRGISKVGIYHVMKGDSVSTAFFSAKCNYIYFDTTVYRRGSIQITKFNLPVISGTFDFVMCKTGCDTIKITQGRFDIKF